MSGSVEAGLLLDAGRKTSCDMMNYLLLVDFVVEYHIRRLWI